MRKNPTDAERTLWRALRAKRLAAWKFRHQERLDPYIVDFVCFSARLIVEADGSQHLDNAYDIERDAWLKAQGFRVLRFWNNDILARTDGVLTSILHALESGGTGIEPAPSLTPLPGPPPQGGREKKDQSFG